MKMTVLCAGLSTPHAGWAAIDELAQLTSRYFDATLLSTPAHPDPLWRRMSGRQRPRFAPIQCPGGDVLFVVARGPEDLALAGAIPDVRRKFSRIHAFVTDSYFHAGYVRETALYDSITVTAHEDVAYPSQRFGIGVHQLYQGADAMRWSPREEQARSIDLIAYGRTPPSYHAAFSRRFHDDASAHLYLHSPLGNLAGPSVHLERGMLFKLLHRSSISLAFNLLVEPQGSRPRSMMVTSRWLESLLAGCIVAGHRPVSRMAEEMLDWPGATVELPQEPHAAADRLEAMLANRDGFALQRRRNIERVLTRHDWRHRIDRLCTLMGWTRPARLEQDLGHLQDLAARWAD